MGRWEQSGPRNAVIFVVTALSALALLALKPALTGYFDGMSRGIVSDQLRAYDDLAMVRAGRERTDAQLYGGGLTIDRAMEQLASQGRMAFPAIRPEAGPEQVVDALRGWSQLAREVPGPRAPAPPPPTLPDIVSPDVLLELEGAAPGVDADVEVDAP